MKGVDIIKYLKFLLLLFFVFFSIPKVNALTMKDGSPITKDNFPQYVNELGYDYWRTNIGSDYFALIPSSPLDHFFIVRAQSDTVQLLTDDDQTISCVDNLCEVLDVYLARSDIGFDRNYLPSSNIRYRTNQVISSFSMKKYNSDEFHFEANFFGDTRLFYQVEFKNVPEDSNLLVYDSNNNLIANNSYVYSLKSGEYKYTFTNSLYQDITQNFSVNGDMVIQLDLKEKLDISSFNVFYNVFCSKVEEISKVIFDFKNPIFLVIISFILVFAFVLFIKKLLGGSI